MRLLIADLNDVFPDSAILNLNFRGIYARNLGEIFCKQLSIAK